MDSSRIRKYKTALVVTLVSLAVMATLLAVDYGTSVGSLLTASDYYVDEQGDMVARASHNPIRTARSVYASQKPLSSYLSEEAFQELKYIAVSTPSGGYMRLAVSGFVRFPSQSQHSPPEIELLTPVGAVRLVGLALELSPNIADTFSELGFAVTASSNGRGRRLLDDEGLITHGVFGAPEQVGVDTTDGSASDEGVDVSADDKSTAQTPRPQCRPKVLDKKNDGCTEVKHLVDSTPQHCSNPDAIVQCRLDASKKSESTCCLEEILRWPAHALPRLQRAADSSVPHVSHSMEAFPLSAQLKHDMNYLKSALSTQEAVSSAYKESARAFELVLGSALLTYKPLLDVYKDFVLKFLEVHAELLPEATSAEDDGKPYKFANIFPGECYAGSTPDLPKDTTVEQLKAWVRDPSTNLRELATRFYEAMAGSRKAWMQHDEYSGACCNFQDRIIDPKGLFPRSRMPKQTNGLGWVHLQRSMVEGRNKTPKEDYWFEGNVVHSNSQAIAKAAESENLVDPTDYFWRPRRQLLQVIDPPLSEQERQKMETCPVIEGTPYNPEAKETRWQTGKFNYLVTDGSPLWAISNVTGLPVNAGASGSTWSIMSTAEMLEIPTNDLYLLRLALMGWMIPMQDHSLLEVCMGAARAFPGVSYPRWGQEAHSLADWQSIHSHLLPDDFHHRGVSLDSLNAHIEDYIQRFNAKHHSSVQWPSSTRGGTVRWWQHDVFAYMLEDLVDLKARAVKKATVHLCSPSLWEMFERDVLKISRAR